MQTILEVKNLSKTYHIDKNNKYTALKDINLEIKKGEFVSVMGASGSGKSTLLYAVSGMDKPTSGSVLFNNQEISDLSENKLSEIRLQQMGFIFQQNYLLKNLNLMDNILLPAYHSKKETRSDINNTAEKLMKETGILGIAQNDITQASGGQLQRVSICRALINDPDILFGDEPTGALNSKSAIEVIKILDDVNKSGTTILLVTHDSKIAAKTERVLFMLDGSIIAEKYLGKYEEDKNNDKIREKELNEWLFSLGF